MTGASPVPGPAGSGTALTAAGLMALAPLALGAREAAPLSERPGTAPLRRQGQGHAIRDIRPWAEGDDPRHLDAAATARTGQPQVRSFHEDRERTVLLIADFRRPMLWGTRDRFRSVAAAEALALIGWQEVTAGGAAGIAALTEAGVMAEPPAPGARGMARVAACLARAHALALETAAGRQGSPPPSVHDLAPDLARAARMAPRGALVVLATGLDAPGEGFKAALAGMARRGPVRILLIEDAFEAAPPAHPLPVATPEGRLGRASFAALPADRAARVDRLIRPGVTVERRSGPPTRPAAGGPGTGGPVTRGAVTGDGRHRPEDWP